MEIMRTCFTSALICACAIGPGMAQLSPSDFETPEFYANWGLDPIRAQHAWSQGFTGEGEKLVIIDVPVQITHPEFQGRALDSIPNQPFPNEGFPIPSHGTHVMGLAGAARNDNGMMGVAFDAQLFNVVSAYGVPSGYVGFTNWGLEASNTGARVANASVGIAAQPSILTSTGFQNPNWQVMDYLVLFHQKLVPMRKILKHWSPMTW